MVRYRYYLVIDQKSFYASVEAVERKLNPMTAKLVVADSERGNGTICLAVSPALKKLGVKNRCRYFEIPQNIDFITATPRMQLYIDYSANVYEIFLKYLSKDDIYVYSIDESFLDITDYLQLYKMTPKELGMTILNDIRKTLGLYATCGIGTNMYLAKIALDITAKRSPDFIGFLDEELYQKTLWNHMPLTDFWQIGPGTASRLYKYGILCMKDIAYADEQLLYKVLGVNAEYLIDHAWGREPTTIAEVKNYKPQAHSLSSGQVLFRDYKFDEGKLIVKEMVDLLCLDMTDKGLVTNSLSMYIGYSSDIYPPARGTSNLTVTTNASSIMIKAFIDLYDRIVNRSLPIRRVCIICNKVMDEVFEQLDLFTDPEIIERDRNIQHAILEIQGRYGKNAVLRGMDFEEGATTRDRNIQIGGHKS